MIRRRSALARAAASLLLLLPALAAPALAGRCTGSATCTTCKTCQYCAYCNAGVTCGVCARESAGRGRPGGSAVPGFR